MKHISMSLYFLLLLPIVFMYCDENRDVNKKWNDIKNQVVTTAQSTWDGASNFVKGMGQSFGYVTADYYYSLQVWNDAPAPVFVAIQHVTPVLGADFSGNIANSSVVLPNETSGTTFYKQQLYISVWLCADSGRADIQGYPSDEAAEKVAVGNGVDVAIKGLFGGIITTEKLKQYSLLRQDIYPWPPHDDNIYYYRMYTDAGKVKGEYLGIKATTQEFIGTFYNNSTVDDVTLNFSKDGKSYTVSLEAQSFSLLQSTVDKPLSIRPASGEKRGFVFSNKQKVIGYLPIAPQGIANVSYNEKTKKYDTAGSMMYTYEVYDNKGSLAIGMQGLSVGNFTQPASERVRDINPVECHIWYQSAGQAEAIDKKTSTTPSKQDYSAISFDTPETLWIVYKTKDFTVQKKVARGAVVDFDLIRPQIAEKEGWLYGVLLNTQDDKKAEQFLDRLSSGKIAPAPISTAITQSQQGIIEAKKNNVIDDTTGKDSSGLIGTLLLADCFMPHGITADTFYYYIEPAELRIDQLINAFYFDDSYYTKNSAGQLVLQDAVQKEIADKIPQWITSYQTNKNAVISSIKEYIQQKGNKGLFTNPTAQPAGRTFSSQGQHIFDMFISGPISIENYPIIRKAGVNYYVYGLGAKPSQWPS